MLSLEILFDKFLISLDSNSTVIDTMLLLVNKYGLSHVCALEEFQNIEVDKFKPLYNGYNFPYLDIYISGYSTIEFYYRGSQFRKLKFKNLFEYLLWTALNGQGRKIDFNSCAFNTFFIIFNSDTIVQSIFDERQNENLVFCLKALFEVEEVTIQEDFLQISELVQTEKYFMNRSLPMKLIENLTIPTLSIPSSIYRYLGESHQSFFTEYVDTSALLSENFFSSSRSVMYTAYELTHSPQLLYAPWHDPVKRDFWILGANFDEISRIDSKKGLKCGAKSCYEMSLESGKICKPGKFFNILNILNIIILQKNLA